MSTDFAHLTESQLTDLDATLGAPASQWWDSFYRDRAKPCPFFVASPDESLAQWVHAGAIRPGRAVDLGCGNGRNAIFLARQGFSVYGVDTSQTAIDWARERAAEAGADLSLTHGNVFDWTPKPAAYDLVYDSGCFHHIPPHRRTRYVDLVTCALRPGGFFGLTCFRPEGGSGYSDDEVYERRSMGGGLGFEAERLREIWSGGLQVRVIRQMRKQPADSGLFGEDFLWVLLAQKRDQSADAGAAPLPS